jgi:hypothetical protein
VVIRGKCEAPLVLKENKPFFRAVFIISKEGDDCNIWMTVAIKIPGFAKPSDI